MMKERRKVSLLGIVMLLSVAILFARGADSVWAKTYAGDGNDVDYSAQRGHDQGYDSHKAGRGGIGPSLGPKGVGLHDVGNIELLIDDVGGADGWRYTHIWPKATSIDHLYWNWLAIGYSPFNVSDGRDGDWVTTPGGHMAIIEPGFVADEEGYAQYHDTTNGIEVTQVSYAWGSPPDDDYVIVKYTVRNIGATSFSTLFAGHSSDFDVLGEHGSSPTDMSDFDSTRSLAYMYDTSSTWHVGVGLLEGTYRGYHQGWYSSSDAEKFYALSIPGADPPTPYPDDWCFWLSTGPYLVLPGDSVIVAFAFVAGEDLSDLRANADRAQEKWNWLGVEEQAVNGDLPSLSDLYAYPNPSGDKTVVKYRLSRSSEVNLVIYNALGQKISMLVNQRQHVGMHTVVWDGRDHSGDRVPPGVYFLRLVANPVGIAGPGGNCGEHKATRKLLVVR